MTADRAPPPPDAPAGNHLAEAARRELRRQEAARHNHWLRALAMIGGLGWLVIAPTLGGIWLGRQLDRALGQGGIFWTGALLMVGLALGCWMAWRRAMPPTEPKP